MIDKDFLFASMIEAIPESEEDKRLVEKDMDLIMKPKVMKDKLKNSLNCIEMADKYGLTHEEFHIKQLEDEEFLLETSRIIMGIKKKYWNKLSHPGKIFFASPIKAHAEQVVDIIENPKKYAIRDFLDKTMPPFVNAMFVAGLFASMFAIGYWVKLIINYFTN